MARFKLDPNKTAMENVFECASMATSVLLSCHAWYHLYGELRDELFDEVRDATVAHFITYKVKLHRYCRQAKDGRPLNFADNMLSSAFSVCGNIANTYLKRLSKITKTEDIEPFAYGLGPGDGFPLYVSDAERENRYHPRKMNRVWDRASAVRKEYEDYVLECREWGIQDIIGLGQWMTRNGYGNDSELFFYMESKHDRKKLLQGQARWVAEQKQAERDALIKNKSVLHAQIYNREYKKRKRHEEWKRRSLEFEKLFGKPPEGHIWKERRGVVGLYKLKEEK